MSAMVRGRSSEPPRHLHRLMRDRKGDLACSLDLDGKVEGNGRILCADDWRTNREVKQSISIGKLYRALTKEGIKIPWTSTK